MTNYERIKNMSVEEMANEFVQATGCCSCPRDCQRYVLFDDCLKNWIDWINQEVEEWI